MARLPDDRYLAIYADDDVRIGGTRVGLEHLIESYLAGATAEQLAVEFPSVSLEQVHGVLAYYLRHQKLVDDYRHAYHAASRVRQQQRLASEAVQRLRQLASQRTAP
jgi:uncharacterized protein (DUF433 family)